MNRLFEIASALSVNARQRWTMRKMIEITEGKIAAREAAMVPEGGWPGSNADTRKAMEKAAKAVDLDLIELKNDLSTHNAQLENYDLDRDELIAERQAWEWTVRDRETTKPPRGHNSSVFEDMALWQDEQYQIARDAQD